MYLSNVIMLAANTSRSKAYAQILAKNNIKLHKIICFENSDVIKSGQSDGAFEARWEESPVFLPNLSIPLQKTLPAICDDILPVSSDQVNNTDIIGMIRSIAPEIVLYSGYGSQIVGKELLETCPRIVHLHSGWLPDFRGSTTTYYHLLKDAKCAVSAIFLDKEIDRGVIIARRYYPRPPSCVNIDYLYDSAIRADLLLHILQFYAEEGRFPMFLEQIVEDGATYYIIHPVLKHIAILSLEKNI